MKERDKLKKRKAFKFFLWKKYFDIGFGYLYYPKYVFLLVGMGDVIASDGDSTRVIIGGIIIAISCFIFGRICVMRQYPHMEQEIGNMFNLFVKEMRKEKDI